MMNKILVLALSLIPMMATSATANDRYRERPPIIVSPDLTAPWIMQLSGAGARPTVYPARPAKPRAVYQQQRAARDVQRRQPNARRGDTQPVALRPNKVIR